MYPKVCHQHWIMPEFTCFGSSFQWFLCCVCPSRGTDKKETVLIISIFWGSMCCVCYFPFHTVTKGQLPDKFLLLCLVLRLALLCVFFSFLCHIFALFICVSVLMSSMFSSLHPFSSPCMLASGLLFLLRGAVPPVPAARLHLLLRHLLIYWSGERQATGGWHRVVLGSTFTRHALPRR